MTIIFATNNENKLAEIQHVLGDAFKLLSLKDVGFSGEIPETGERIEDNALEKAEFIASRFNYPVFSDDTGLEIFALGGKPGVHTAHYSGSRNSDQNMQKVLEELEQVADRKAQFRTVIAFVNGARKLLFEGKVEGKIADKPTGEDGFGYDPIFIPKGETRTFAQMSMSEKASQSHRVRALGKFTDYLSGLQT